MKFTEWAKKRARNEAFGPQAAMQGQPQAPSMMGQPQTQPNQAQPAQNQPDEHAEYQKAMQHYSALRGFFMSKNNPKLMAVMDQFGDNLRSAGFSF